MKAIRKVELVAIGDELLNGLRTNTHLLYFGEKLLQNGLALGRASEIRDDPNELLNGLKEAFDRSDLIILSGGLGPTTDDNTAACVAAALTVSWTLLVME